jgi:hypothetical protein
MSLSRRQLLKRSIALPAVPMVGCSTTIEDYASKITGTIGGASLEKGHLIRESQMNPGTVEIIDTEVLIIGGGASGLSCAYHLQKQGLEDFTLIELESQPGGNARSGENNFTRFPYGAHYVTVANLKSQPLINFYADIGVIIGFDENGIPYYNKEYMCKAPLERIHNGRFWEDNYLPYANMSSVEKDDIERFYTYIEDWRERKGSDGRLAFTIPMETSSKDPEILKYDKLSFAQLLNLEGFHSTPLLWYANYCCRDDFGAGIDKVSAWAGLHYFCARQGFGANTGENSVITWPEGNQWLIDKLKEKVKSRIFSDCMATHVKKQGEKYCITSYDFKNNQMITYRCNQLIMATPKFVNQHLLRGIKSYRNVPQYAPWIVATITAKKVPGNQYARLCWDNFNYLGQGLGYIYAQHQTGKKQTDEYTLSYYWPIDHLPPKEARQWLLSRSQIEWNEDILRDLESMNPGISQHISSIDIWRWGHAMAIPEVGSLWSGDRFQDNLSQDGIFFSHSDMSGFSIFEEAFDRGYRAAKEVITARDHQSVRAF